MKFRRALAGFGLALVVLAAGFWPSNAWAVADSVDSWSVNYVVDADGTLHVKETIVWRFGTDSGRHGIYRWLTTREAWGDTNQDAVYRISNIGVTSPDASANYTTATLGSGRDQQLYIKIGSADQVITRATATYVLIYDVAGALRTSDDPSNPYDALYWDAIGDDTPQTSDVVITVQVPGGVQQTGCANGPAGTSNPCTSATIGSAGVATYVVASKAPGSILTIDAMISPGLVANNQPILVDRADKASASAGTTALATTGGVAVLTALGVGVMAHRNRRDQRFLGVAPGSIDPSGSGVGNDNHPVIPVSFAPPDIPVAAAGFIDDGAVDVRDTTAALLSLAVRGAIQLRQDESRAKSWVFGGVADQTIYARLLDPSVPMAPHEAKLLKDMFRGLRAGSEKALTGQGTLYAAYMDMRTNVRAEAEAAGWYTRMPAAGVTAASAGTVSIVANLVASLIRLVVPLVIAGFALIGGVSLGWVPSMRWLTWAGPIFVLILGLIVYRGLTHRGQRSAIGRAYADQVTGFREYLATAEADQIRFEEGEDIFSQYLPWAVIYDLTDRWTKVCAQLVAAGRLQDIQPTWYYGNIHAFNAFTFTQSLASVSTASLPAVSTSGSGFGGGTGFSGGGFGGGFSGFSGGGGGGGGAGSW